MLKTFVKTKIKTKTFISRPRPRPRLVFLSSRRLETKTLVSRTTSLLSTYGTRAFGVAGPVCWNALPDYLKSSDLSFDVFKHTNTSLKPFYVADTDTTTVAH